MWKNKITVESFASKLKRKNISLDKLPIMTWLVQDALDNARNRSGARESELGENSPIYIDTFVSDVYARVLVINEGNYFDKDKTIEKMNKDFNVLANPDTNTRGFALMKNYFDAIIVHQKPLLNGKHRTEVSLIKLLNEKIN